VFLLFCFIEAVDAHLKVSDEEASARAWRCSVGKRPETGARGNARLFAGHPRPSLSPARAYSISKAAIFGIGATTWCLWTSTVRSAWMCGLEIKVRDEVRRGWFPWQ
jgi:hypothetical protein